MKKSWLDWLRGSAGDRQERRAAVPQPIEAIGPDDIDPMTGALKWERFVAMLDAEQRQAGGTLLIIDLGGRSRRGDMLGEGSEQEILPWLAEAVRQAIRGDDLIAHSDGYRFAVLLRGAAEDVSQAVTERILESVDNTIFMTARGIARIEVAVGGSVFESASEHDVLRDAIAMYEQAVRSGNSSLIT
jgi:GGDEF domain-containing protein